MFGFLDFIHSFILLPFGRQMESPIYNKLKVANSSRHVIRCLLLTFLYLTIVTIWLAVDNHQEVTIESDEEYLPEMDTYSSTFTKDCTSDNFQIWATSLVLILICPMFILIYRIVSSPNIKTATKEEKVTILSLINLVTITIFVMFSVELTYSIVIQKILIATVCLFVSVSNVSLLKLRTIS